MLQIAVFLAAVLALTPVLGGYMARVFMADDRSASRGEHPLEPR
jgi:hypothetical protein